MEVEECEYRVVVKRWTESVPIPEGELDQNDLEPNVVVDLRSEEWFRISDGVSTRSGMEPAFAVYNDDTNFAYFQEWRDNEGRPHNPNPHHREPARIVAGPSTVLYYFNHGELIGSKTASKSEYTDEHSWRVLDWDDYVDLRPKPADLEP